MIIGIPKETAIGETRVTATPQTVSKYVKLGFDVLVEEGAGLLSSFTDNEFADAGATLATSGEKIRSNSDIFLTINPPTANEIDEIKEGATVISMLSPANNSDILEAFAKRDINALSIDILPRISRAQKMDILSSIANISGYRAVIESANHFGRFFTGQMTAAGKTEPAKVLVIGAGVAGLSAIGTATSLGAVVYAFDTRPEVKEQVESMGASFLSIEIEEEASSGDGYAKTMSKAFIEAEMQLFAEKAKEVDIIVTTAMVPGNNAPKLITKEMVSTMQQGSIIVDMAAGCGGNCELTEKDVIKQTENGVKIIGYTNYSRMMPVQSSRFFANNLYQLVKELRPSKESPFAIDMSDQVVRGVTVVYKSEITFPPPPVKVAASPPLVEKKELDIKVETPTKNHRSKKHWTVNVLILIGVFGIAYLGSLATSAFLSHLTVFVLACFVGYQVVWNVTAALHTPLMSVTNAISGIIILGALLQTGSDWELSTILSLIAVLIATINVVGGFYVTQRMLNMFRKD